MSRLLKNIAYMTAGVALGAAIVYTLNVIQNEDEAWDESWENSSEPLTGLALS
ncbi:MAG: hypothetical protein LBN03_00130 [Bifidobacteriaceae bacterium]|nr:hypothetical protein [Bifidobacteriaceae bacterium]